MLFRSAVIDAADKNIHLTRGLRFQYHDDDDDEPAATEAPAYTPAPTPVPTATPRPTPVP